ncbi:MAG: trehalose-phosphatase [Planctomycetota bacterium]
MSHTHADAPTPDTHHDERTLDPALDRLASSPVLLIATDYDGTLAPIVEDPTNARPSRESIVALRALTELPQTHVAVISGRSLRDLADMTKLGEEVMLVGSHGSEFDQDFSRSLTQDQRDLRERIVAEMRRLAEPDRHFHIEEKPASIAFHYRNVEPDVASVAVNALIDGPVNWDGVQAKFGKMVLELSVVHTSKGTAIDTLRQRVGATHVMYVGDDVTDEDAFARLTGPDVSIKVGEGATDARYRVDDTEDVARFLAHLVEARRAWLAGAQAVPIEQHALLSDGRTFAMVTPDARVVWMCLPRVDAPALFAELVGGPTAGHFTITPSDNAAPTNQRYDGEALILRTEWGRLSVTDFLDCSGGRPGQRAGRSDLIRVIEGRGEVTITFAPRIDFGRQATTMTIKDDGLEVNDSLDPIVLRAPGVDWTLEPEGMHQTAIGRAKLNGEPLRLEFRYGTGTLRERQSAAFGERYRLTKAYWESWADKLTLPRRERDAVRRSALTLKALCYGPTGGIAAAATTSLPEHLGGVRNWDYRFCWVRDAAMTAASLVKLGSVTEAMDFLDWVLLVLDRTGDPERLMPLYTCTGHEVNSEAEIGELAGYAGSRPVRVGNAASRQVQLDVFGPVVDLIHLLLTKEAPLSGEHWRLTEAMVSAVQMRWAEPDHGIWEIRKPRRHHTHSKVMCWVTVDRGIKISERFLDRQRPDWEALRDEIASDILTNAWKDSVKAYTAAYDGEDADAAALYVGLTGLVDPGDERFASTVEMIERELRDGPTVYRYLEDDGLPGHEGGFFICASWLVDAYLRVGRRADAESLFEELIELAGPTGLIPEQYDPQAKRTLGNHPQAYSHIGIIENAIALSA